MTASFTQQGCKIETTHTIQPNGTFSTEIVLSVDPTSALALAVEENVGQSIAQRVSLPPRSSRIRSTKYGFELVPERGRG